MKAWRLGLKDLLAIRIDRKEDLLRGIEQALAEHNVSDGVIVSACGSVTTYRIHMVDTVTYPHRLFGSEVWTVSDPGPAGNRGRR